MCISNKLLTVRVKLVLLVVNSVKLHLTAFNVYNMLARMLINLPSQAISLVVNGALV